MIGTALGVKRRCPSAAPLPGLMCSVAPSPLQPPPKFIQWFLVLGTDLDPNVEGPGARLEQVCAEPGRARGALLTSVLKG